LYLRLDFKDEYIFLTDIAKYKNTEYPSDVINNWMRNRSTVEYLGLWKRFYNADLNSLEFEGTEKETETIEFKKLTA